MNKIRNNFNVISVCITILVLFLTQLCCSNNEHDDSDLSSNKIYTSTEPPPLRQASVVGDVLRSSSFPITDDKNKLSGYQTFSDLDQILILYCETFNQMPENLNNYLHGGFPLFWGRNLKNGLPVKILQNIQSDPDYSNFGEIQYTKTGESTASIMFVTHDREIDDESDDNYWKIEQRTISTSLNRQYSFEESESVIWITGGMVKIDSVENPGIRLLYSQFGQLASYLTEKTSRYYAYQKEFPGSFSDVINMQQFFIEENLTQFKQAIADSNVDFKWGIDHDRNEVYIWLKIQDELLISGCDKYSESGIPFPHECNPDETNMTAPLLTTKDILNLEIPENYMTSINEIESVSY